MKKAILILAGIAAAGFSAQAQTTGETMQLPGGVSYKIAAGCTR